MRKSYRAIKVCYSEDEIIAINNIFDMQNKLVKALKKPKLVLIYILNKLGFILSDRLYLKAKYRLLMGKPLDLENPRTFNEKLQWLKLHNRDSKFTQMVDKYSVKQYVAECIGDEYIIPTIGVWDNFDDLDFDILPDKFVLKCTHDSGGLTICRDKSIFDIEQAREKINRSLKNNYYFLGREWPYKNVPKKIIAEEYLEEENGELCDYKFFCFNGVADCVMLCIDRFKGDVKFYFFDRDWNLLRLNKRGKEAPSNFTLPKPEKMDEMFAIAEKLSEGLPFARVDLYYVNKKIYFGEITFYPDNGFDNNLLPETDSYFGDKIKLNKIKLNQL